MKNGDTDIISFKDFLKILIKGEELPFKNANLELIELEETDLEKD